MSFASWCCTCFCVVLCDSFLILYYHFFVYDNFLYISSLLKSKMIMTKNRHKILIQIENTKKTCFFVLRVPCCSTCLFCWGQFVMLPFNLTLFYGLQHVFFEHLFNSIYVKVWERHLPYWLTDQMYSHFDVFHSSN